MKWEYGFKVALLSEEDGGGYLIEVPDLPGCMTDGDTPEEAVQKLESAIDLWIETARENGKKIPEPKYYDSSDPSGKFTARIPKQLHKDLIRCAEEQGMSINQLVSFYIAKGVYSGDVAKTSKRPASKKAITFTETVTTIALSDESFKNDWENFSTEIGRINRVLPCKANESDGSRRRLNI
jgi:predicted RNase H-like HicB family nuclease